ncbi:MAG: hypothetical protein FWG82_06675 [Oscillospiraceae bacterium]|nr:hypothetical protein [Oscillospiraceae bacterium]
MYQATTLQLDGGFSTNQSVVIGMVRVCACNAAVQVGAVAFGAGVVLAACLPRTALVIIAAALLIVCGVVFYKSKAQDCRFLRT